MVTILFDIDGTLLRSGGAGRQALNHAFHRMMGVEQATDHLSLSGATDGWILRQMEQQLGAFDRELLQRYYLEELQRLLQVPGRAAACPGVYALVEALQGRAQIGLLTGNWRAGAWIKLQAIDLWLEGPSAFGDDAEDRNLLVPVARRRGASDPVVVVGDTDRDVACARAGGAVAVAVQTGFAEAGELEQSQPDLLLPDLEQGRDAFIALVTSLGSS